MKRSPMRRGKPLARKAAGPRQTPPKPSKTPPMPQEVRELVYARSGDRCELRLTPECQMRQGWFDGLAGRSLHHRRPRRMGGTRAIDIHDPANLLAVCGNGSRGCHHFVEQNRRLALEKGWLLNSGADPVSRSCVLHDGSIVLLRATGYVVLFGADGAAA